MSTWIIVLGIYCIGIVGAFSFFTLKALHNAKKYKWRTVLKLYDLLEYFGFSLIWPIILLVEMEEVWVWIGKCIKNFFAKIEKTLDQPLIVFDYRVKEENKEIV
jgi:hypothetical protein